MTNGRRKRKFEFIYDASNKISKCNIDDSAKSFSSNKHMTNFCKKYYVNPLKQIHRNEINSHITTTLKNISSPGYH